jgi:hypothetical protein
MLPSEFDINSPQSSGFNFNSEMAFQTKSLESFNNFVKAHCRYLIKMHNHNLFDPIVNQLGFQEKLTSQRETGDTLRVGHKFCSICWFYVIVRNSLIYSNDMIQLRVVHNGVMFIATI